MTVRLQEKGGEKQTAELLWDRPQVAWPGRSCTYLGVPEGLEGVGGCAYMGSPEPCLSNEVRGERELRKSPSGCLTP